MAQPVACEAMSEPGPVFSVPIASCLRDVFLGILFPDGLDGDLLPAEVSGLTAILRNLRILVFFS